MKSLNQFVILLFLIISTGKLNAQSLDVNQLPRYVVIGAEDTKLLGGIGIHIAKKRSDAQDAFYYLEYHLHSLKQVRTVTDLLNEMDALGFDYVDTFNAGSKSLGLGDNAARNTGTYGDSEKARYNVVFKKR